MHPSPQIRYVVQDGGASSFGEETVIRGNNDGAVDESEVKDPICEEEGEERGSGNLFITSE